MWMTMAMWNATSSSPPRDFPKTIIHYTKVFEYKVGNKDVPCVKHKIYSSKLKFRLVVVF